ncbi:hypothetical protein CY34DRAFT_19996 [Suillus luteus UH-Slu-Lm8-n1]|uniref:Uncharacterized protein n=1 Tax=Suillus luteus UH-Slu-Lm8-n1 TaxID=930992 RepID=A0A0C9ZQ09_9AGAM|nr:hypothetical protein CY34DRAFT_19996 [Suillus luteus UH-Slu-Lm8-n1]
MSLPTHTPVWCIKNSPEDSVVLDFPTMRQNVYISNDPAQRGLFAVHGWISRS